MKGFFKELFYSAGTGCTGYVLIVLFLRITEFYSSGSFSLNFSGWPFFLPAAMLSVVFLLFAGVERLKKIRMFSGWTPDGVIIIEEAEESRGCPC